MTRPPSQVVVGFNFSHSGRAALFRAIVLVTNAPAHVLHFICAIEPHGPIPAVPTRGRVDYEYAERVQRAMTDEIELQLREAKAADAVSFFVHARIGKPAEEILSLAKDVGADLIIVGSKGITGVERLVLGSVSETVVREAGCSVEVARVKAYPDVELIKIVDAEPNQHKYVAPHRYIYEDRRLIMRPADWPLY